MTNEHLTDAEIQFFITDEKSCDAAIVDHIIHCTRCARKAAEYKILFEGIESQESPIFDFPLADLVMEQLAQPNYKNRLESQFLYLIGLVVILFLAAIIYYFKATAFEIFVKISWLTTGLIAITVACVLVFLVLDMFQKYKKQIDAINYINQPQH